MLYLARTVGVTCKQDSAGVRVDVQDSVALSAGTRIWKMLAGFLTVLMMVGALFGGAVHAEQDFLDPEDAFVFSAAMVTPTELDIHYKIAPKYYMYRERFEFALSANGELLGAPVYPPGIVTYDPTFEKDLEVYYKQVTVRLPVAAGASQPLTLAVTSQGCADAGLCYPPATTEIILKPTPDGYTASGPGVVARVPVAQAQDQNQLKSGKLDELSDASNSGFVSALKLGDTGFAEYLAASSWTKIILLCLALGVLLSFTPCVLPMVPILLALLAGDAGTGKKVSRWRGLSLAAVYVLGMSVVYTALGVAAGLIGASLAVWLQTPWVLALFAVLLALLALAMFDVFTVQAPTAMQSALNDRLSRIPGGRYSGVFLMGMLSALIVGPCVAAPLAGVLLFISQTGDLVLGGSALFALAWGEGLLLLVVGASSGALLPKAGAWMEGVKRLFGILLLATAWWMVNSILPGWLAVVGWAFLALWSAVMLGAFEPLTAAGRLLHLLNKTLGLLLALWAALLIIGVAAGGSDLLTPLSPLVQRTGVAGSGYGGGTVLGSSGAASGKNSDGMGFLTDGKVMHPPFMQVSTVAELDALLAKTDRPVMLDFYADWCVSCIEMERFTFSDPGVAQQMSQLLLVQADVTKNTAEDRALLKRFKLFGPPGIIFFDAQGQQMDTARVVGFKKAREFGVVLERVLAG